MKRNQLIFKDGFTSCHWCGYDANLVTASACEVCNRPLDKAILSRKGTNKLSSAIPVRLLGLSALVLLVGSGYGYWVWMQQAPASTPATKLSRASDIRLYRTMKDVPNVPKGLFSYHSSIALASIVAHGMHDAIHKAHPEFQLRYTEPLHGNPGSTTAIRMLIDGEVSFAPSSRSVEDAEFSRARDRNLTLEQIPVAIDCIVFYTHPDVSIPGLSLNQAQDIFLGKITNWKEIGGPNLPIIPFSLDPKITASPNQALGDVAEKMGQNVQIIRDHTEGIRRVASTPGAISFGGGLNIINQKTVRLPNLAKANSNQYVSPVTEAGEANKQAFRDGTYPLTRRLFIVIRRNSSLDEQAGLAYANLFLSEEGQRIIENSGFVPLY